VARLPECDNHRYYLGKPGVDAHYNARTKTGSWANLCQPCFDTLGVGLGVGYGQRLVVTEPTQSTWLDRQDAATVDEARQVFRSSPQYTRFMEYAGDDESFALWLRLADRRVGRLVGLGVFGIGDWSWRDAYDAGMSPLDAARDALAEDDTFGELFGGE
jgi:hypothetical protein